MTVPEQVVLELVSPPFGTCGEFSTAVVGVFSGSLSSSPTPDLGLFRTSIDHSLTAVLRFRPVEVFVGAVDDEPVAGALMLGNVPVLGARTASVEEDAVCDGTRMRRLAIRIVSLGEVGETSLF